MGFTANARPPGARFYTSVDTPSVLQNRAFQQVQPRTGSHIDRALLSKSEYNYAATSLLAWHPVNGAALAVIADPKPLSAALPNSLQLTVPVGTSGQAGIGNEGYWGKAASTCSRNSKADIVTLFQGSTSTVLGHTLLPSSTVSRLLYLPAMSTLMSPSFQRLGPCSRPSLHRYR